MDSEGGLLMKGMDGYSLNKYFLIVIVLIDYLIAIHKIKRILLYIPHLYHSFSSLIDSISGQRGYKSQQ